MAGEIRKTASGEAVNIRTHAAQRLKRGARSWREVLRRTVTKYAVWHEFRAGTSNAPDRDLQFYGD